MTRTIISYLFLLFVIFMFIYSRIIKSKNKKINMEQESNVIKFKRENENAAKITLIFLNKNILKRIIFKKSIISIKRDGNIKVNFYIENHNLITYLTPGNHVINIQMLEVSLFKNVDDFDNMESVLTARVDIALEENEDYLLIFNSNGNYKFDKFTNINGKLSI